MPFILNDAASDLLQLMSYEQSEPTYHPMSARMETCQWVHAAVKAIRFMERKELKVLIDYNYEKLKKKKRRQMKSSLGGLFKKKGKLCSTRRP